MRRASGRARRSRGRLDARTPGRTSTLSYIQGYDPDTLREIVDARQCTARLGEIGEQRSLPALLERAWLLKVLNRLDDALVVSEESVRVARMGGTRKDLLRSRILHASIMQFRGSYDAAEQELTMCADEADGQGWTSVAAFAHQQRGKVRFDAGEYHEARNDFKRALSLRQDSGAPADQLASILLAVDAADRRRVGTPVAS